MKLSIIVPVYNSENCMRKCIDSILNQTYQNIEVLLVNDGSKDNSLSICNEYKQKDKRVIVIDQENKGACLARKSGILLSTGDIIGFVDSDDYITNDMYEKLIKELQETNSDIAVCGYYFDYVKEQQISIGDKKYVFGKELLYNYLKHNFIECMLWNKIFKKSLFKGIKYFNIKKGEDLLTSIQLINNAQRMCYLNEALYYYYVNPNSIMRSKFNISSLDEIMVFDEQYSFFEKNVKNIKKYKDYLNYRKLNCILRIMVNMCNDISFIKYRKTIECLYNQMNDLYGKIKEKNVIIPLLRKRYNGIRKYKFLYYIYLYLYNLLRKCKNFIERKQIYGR